MKLAFFYHCRLSGGHNVDTGLSIDLEFGRKLFRDQIERLVSTRLIFDSLGFVGVNGRPEDAGYVREYLSGYGNITVLEHGQEAQSLLPTMSFLQSWLHGHEDYAVCFFHTKGVTRPESVFYQDWRKCMEYCVIHQWRRCVADLEAGFDSVGAHWLTNQATDIPTWGNGHFWGGVFWWAKASYLLRLRSLPIQIRTKGDWWEPEHWIGTGPQPRVRDYAPHWPNPTDCGNMASKLER